MDSKTGSCHSIIVRYVSFLSLFAGVTLAQTTSPLALPAAPRYFDYANQINASGQLIVGDYNILQFVATGGTTPYTVMVSSGQLPAGLLLTDNGNGVNAVGVPTAVGTYTFTLTATDSSSPMQTATQSYTVAAVTTPFTVGGSLLGGLVNVPYGVGSGLPPIYARGGIPPYHWTLLGGVTPPGMSAATTTPDFGQGNPPSEISGTPSTPGTFSFTLQVTDSSPTPFTLTQTYTLSVINLTPFTDPNSGQPFGIDVGPDGNLWFTQQEPVGMDNLGNRIYGLESLSTGGSFNNETQLTTQVPNPSGSLANPLPQSITVGPDGSFWMTDHANGAIVAAKSGAPGVVIALHTASGTSLSPTGITSGGSEGGVWFSAVQGFSPGTGIIGRINPANPGSPTLYTIPQTSSYPTGIVQNPQDGNAIWIMDQYQLGPAANQDAVVIGRIPVPVDAGSPFQLPAGCRASNTQLRVTLNECVIPGTQGHVLGPLYGNAPVGPLMQVDSTGTVWFATRDQVGSISADGSKVQLSTIPLPVGNNFRITSLTLGSDGAVWYVGNDSAHDLALIGRVATSGTNSTITQFRIPATTLDTGTSTPQSITTGPDGALWFTDAVIVKGKVVQVFPSLALNCSVPSTLYLNVPIPSNAQCSALGGKAPYTYAFDATNAPPGVTISSSGVLSGTPTAPGSFNIKVSDSSSPVQQANQVISIQAPPTIQLSCSFPSTGTAGQPYSGSCITANGNPPYTYIISPVNALSALGLTGVATTPSGSNSYYGFSVSGNLSVSAYGTVTFAIAAVDKATPVPNTSAPQSITIAITPLPVSLSCSQSAEAVVGQPFRQQCFDSAGTPPYTFSDTGLPSGLSIDASTGIISGTATSLGNAPVNVVVTDSAGQTATQTINFSVVNPPLSLSCVFPPSATVGTAYTAACTAFGGVGPYSYSIGTGTLPAGLTLNPASGTVSGTPNSLGSAFSVQVTDSESPAAMARFFESLFIQPVQLTVLSTSLPVPNPGLPYAAIPIVGGGTPPYTFAISSGALPGGLQLSPASGVISSTAPGSPGGGLTTGPYSFTIQVKDSAGATATQAYSGTILTAPLEPEITSYALPHPAGANGISVGLDSALWFTTLDQTGGNMIGAITTAGAIAGVLSANALTQANGLELPTGGDITPGPDGNMWIAQRDGQVVGEITSGGSQFTYVPPTPNSSPAQITAGPDGTLWFTEAAASQIAHVAPDGSIVEFPTPTPGAYPLGIAGGAGGFIVYTEPLVNKIAFISSDGKTTGEFTIPTANALPTSIVLGLDNAFWFTEYGANKIGRVDFSGNFLEFPVSYAPTAITVGPDGALYFTETAGNRIGRITIAGALTEFVVPDMNSGPTGIAAGPDGALWFTENAASRIGRLSFIFGPMVSCTLPPSPQTAGTPFSGSCSATQGTPPYTLSASGNPPPGLTIDPTTGAISGTLTTAGTFSFNVIVTDSSTPPLTGQQSYTFTVSPLPLGISCNPPAAHLYTAYATPAYGCPATNGTPPYTYALTSGTLPPGLTGQAGTGNITGTPTAPGTFPISVQVTDSSTPVMTASMASTIEVLYGAVTSTGGPLFTLSAPPISVDPGGAVPGLTLTANEPLRAGVTGMATLTFTRSGLLQNTPAGYVDPAMQFDDGKGSGTGTAYNFTIPSGSSSITLPAFNVGTVAGSINIAITADGVEQTGGLVIVPPAAPVIESGSVQFTNVTSTAFDLEFVATSATRSVSTATITLNPSPGDQIVGQSTFTLDVSKVMDAWFSSSASFPYGGRFSFTIPFELSGDVKAIASATVTVSATAGNPSQPVTGNR